MFNVDPTKEKLALMEQLQAIMTDVFVSGRHECSGIHLDFMTKPTTQTLV